MDREAAPNSDTDFGEKVCHLFNHGLSNEEIAKIIVDDSGGAEDLVARIRVLEDEAGWLQNELDEMTLKNHRARHRATRAARENLKLRLRVNAPDTGINIDLAKYVAAETEHSRCKTCNRLLILLFPRTGDVHMPRYYMCKCGMLAQVGKGVIEEGGGGEEGCPNCDGTGRDSCPLCSGTNKAFPEEENTKQEDVPKDILKALEVDASSLDESVHDEKGGEAAGINNDGFWSQIDYLRSNGWTWTDFRKSLGLSSSEKGDRPSETDLAHERMRDKYGEGS